MRDPPLSVELSWPKPNYTNPVTKATSVVALTSICIPLMTIIVLLRLYTRLRVTKCFGADDWMIIPSLFTGIGYSACALVGIKYGWYKHIWDVPVLRLAGARKTVVAASLFGLLNVACTKLSVLLLYRRLFPPSATQRATNILILFTASWMVAMSVTNFLFCIPLRAYWDVLYTGPQTCLSEVPYFVSFSGIDLALDIAVYILPLHELGKLHMPRRQKAIILGIFSFGILAIGAAALRLPSIVRASSSYDVTWELYDVSFWTVIEATVGIVCASVPSLKPLIERYVPVLLGSLASSSRDAESAERDKLEELSTFPSQLEQSQNNDRDKDFVEESVVEMNKC